jgi:hypothetical protein
VSQFAGRTVLAAFDDDIAYLNPQSFGAWLQKQHPQYLVGMDECRIAGILCQEFGVTPIKDDYHRVFLNFPPKS